jgi:phosphotransferase system  glucose/maltose/N-acetylglucosamine-specific IIC component
MLPKLMALAAVVAIACMSYLLLTPMERDTFFLTSYLGKVMFPKLARDQRQRRLTFIAGTLLCSLVVAGFMVFLIKYMSKAKGH